MKKEAEEKTPQQEPKVKINYTAGVWESTVIGLPLVLYIFVVILLFEVMAGVDNTTMGLIYIFGAVPMYGAILLWTNALAAKYSMRHVRKTNPELADELEHDYCLTGYSTGRHEYFHDFVFERKDTERLASGGMRTWARIISCRYLLLMIILIPLIIMFKTSHE